MAKPPARRRSLACSACESPKPWEYTVASAYASALRSGTSRAKVSTQQTKIGAMLKSLTVHGWTALEIKVQF